MKQSILQTAMLAKARLIPTIAAQAQNLFTPVTDQNAGASPNIKSDGNPLYIVDLTV